FFFLSNLPITHYSSSFLADDGFDCSQSKRSMGLLCINCINNAMPFRATYHPFPFIDSSRDNSHWIVPRKTTRLSPPESSFLLYTFPQSFPIGIKNNLCSSVLRSSFFS